MPARQVHATTSSYDGHDDMVRDVRNYTFNHSIDSLSRDHAVGDPPLIDLLDQIRETTDLDLGLSPAGSSPPADGAPAVSYTHLTLPTIYSV